jgi:predicted metal-dependent phosphoesterase TrpH
MLRTMHIDLHTHTNASDGALSPSELLERAVAQGVTSLSITDHDSVDAYASLSGENAEKINLIPGIELSTSWCGRNIHVLGLNIDPYNHDLANGILAQKAARQHRAEKIASRLRKVGIPDLLGKVLQVAGDSTIGRPHFAEILVAEGAVTNLSQAYKKYLGNGKPGDVRQYWASMSEVVDWIRSAGGTAVLAHPGHYKLTNTKMRALGKDFVASGGQSIEVCNGVQSETLTRKLAQLCDDLKLSASCGSDFHNSNNAWSEVGRFSPLPASCNPIWENW